MSRCIEVEEFNQNMVWISVDYTTQVARIGGNLSRMHKAFRIRARKAKEQSSGFQLFKRDRNRLYGRRDELFDHSKKYSVIVLEMLKTRDATDSCTCYEPKLMKQIVKEATAHPDFAL